MKAGSTHLRFDFVDISGKPAPLVFEHPSDVLEARRIDEVQPVIAAAEAARAVGQFVAGFVAYEAAPAFDAGLKTRPPGDLPLAWFGIFDAPVAAPTAAADPPPSPLPPLDGWQPDITRADYDDALARIRTAIGHGDSYQANFTFRLRSVVPPSSLAARYHQLRATHRPPYAAYFDLGRWQLLSLSPELFFRLDDGAITTRPMKGTIGRGRFADEDDRQADVLRTSAKDRAENVMIADLMRNDIGRIATVGSVEAVSLFDIEPYPAVYQMTSTISGRVRPGTTLTDVFAALFPAGSITGAPKLSSMQLLAALERSPRGVYCGAMGYLAPGGAAVFNVAIRTAVADRQSGRIELGVGGGITWDSVPGDEYAEARSKAAFLDVSPAFSLIETMRMESGQFIRRERHLRRLRRSARYFGMTCNTEHLASTMAEHTRLHPEGTRRARLQLGPDGTVTVESHPFAPSPSGGPPAPVVYGQTPVSSGDRFLFHKTTHRRVYDDHRTSAPAAFDVLLWNERGDITEFTRGNVVVEVDGQRWTPPIECGLLGGMLREEALADGTLAERVLSRQDVQRATRLWFINSLRGWVEVRL